MRRTTTTKKPDTREAKRVKLYHEIMDLAQKHELPVVVVVLDTEGGTTTGLGGTTKGLHPFIVLHGLKHMIRHIKEMLEEVFPGVLDGFKMMEIMEGEEDAGGEVELFEPEPLPKPQRPHGTPLHDTPWMRKQNMMR